MQQAGQQAKIGDFLRTSLKGDAAVARLVAAPAAGGASLRTTIGGAETALSSDGCGIS